MIADTSKTVGFMFTEKLFPNGGIYIPPVRKLRKHGFSATFTTGKPNVPRVSENAYFRKHGKHTRQGMMMMGKGVLR